MTDPRDPHRAEREADKRARYHAAMLEADTPNTAHLEAQAIADCRTCDTEGYTPSRRVCDHRQHSTPAGRAAAIATVRAALTKDRS